MLTTMLEGMLYAAIGGTRPPQIAIPLYDENLRIIPPDAIRSAVT
jgi:hypothetical protein